MQDSLNPESFKNIATSDVEIDTDSRVIGSAFIILGITGLLCTTFVSLTLIKQLHDKRGIYPLIKSNIWFELLLMIHIIKSGIGSMMDISNSIVCKVDSGMTFFSMNMACYYYDVLIVLMIYNKGNYPKLTRYRVYLIFIPAFLIGLISVILLFSYDLSGTSPWNSCFISDTIDLDISVLYIPQFILFALSLVLFILVYIGNISLTGIMRHFQLFTLSIASFFILTCVSYYAESRALGVIATCFICANIIVFRMSSDVIIYSFKSGVSSNKIIHFLAVLLCIDSPPEESEALEIEKEEKIVLENIKKEKEAKKAAESQYYTTSKESNDYLSINQHSSSSNSDNLIEKGIN